MQKVIKDLNKYANSQDKGPWPQSRVSALDRALGELLRILEKKVCKSSLFFFLEFLFEVLLLYFRTRPISLLCDFVADCQH